MIPFCMTKVGWSTSLLHVQHKRQIINLCFTNQGITNLLIHVFLIHSLPIHRFVHQYGPVTAFKNNLFWGVWGGEVLLQYYPKKFEKSLTVVGEGEVRLRVSSKMHELMVLTWKSQLFAQWHTVRQLFLLASNSVIVL